MAASMQLLMAWFDEGVANGATHMIIVCDTFDYEDCPVFVNEGDDAREKSNEYNGKKMQRVMEVYDLRMDKDFQFSERRAFHY